MKTRIISVFLCAVMIFSAAVMPASAVRSAEARTIISAVDKGYPMSSVADILTGIYQINKFINAIVGVPIFTEEAFAISVDDTVQGVIDEIIKEKGVDFGEVFSSIPSLTRSADIITSTLHVNIPVLQGELVKAANALRAQGKTTFATIVGLIRVWLGVIDDCQIQLNPVDGKSGIYRFDAVITYRDGRTETCQTNIIYNKNTNELTNMDGGPAILGFSMDLDQMTTFTGVNVWQRKFGFCLEYDLFCFLTPYIMNYVTQRIKFIYDGREWMCQIWKGTYFITNGGEVGFYNRPLGSLGTFYKCIEDKDLLDMTLEVYHGNDLLFKRGPIKHWWITGFEVDDTCYAPVSLTLISTITMKDKEMFDAFTKALDKKKAFIDYETNGLDVTITW